MRPFLGERRARMSRIRKLLTVVAGIFVVFFGLIAVASLTDRASIRPADIVGPPRGWVQAGSKVHFYRVGVDPAVSHGGQASAYIQSRNFFAALSGGFGTLMQAFDAEAYRGQRLRLSAFVKTEAVSNRAGLWMRIDGVGATMLALDNMHDRPISRTTDWARYEIVLDVPREARLIAFGILLQGRGRAWIDDVRFAAVDSSVPVTGHPATFLEPTNLDFEARDRR
jgi:hypothetical protein